jgi:hypothetical protein
VKYIIYIKMHMSRFTVLQVLQVCEEMCGDDESCIYR